MERDFDHGVSGGHGRPPELALSEFAEAGDEAVKLTRQGVRGVFQGEGDELPRKIFIASYEVQNSVARLLLDPPPAHRANSQFACFTTQEETAGFEVPDDERVASASLETCDPVDVRVDVR